MREHIIAIAFCLIVLGITGTTVVNMVLDYIQPRVKSEEEKWHEQEQNKEDTALDYFLDNLAGKKQGAKLATKISTKTSGMTYIESTQVLLGKEDWLFYKSVEDGDPLADFEGLNHYEEENLQDMAQKLQEDEAFFQSIGSEFYILSIPNKSNIYTEYMPDTVTKQNDKTRTDDFCEYLQQNTNLHVINVKDALLNLKDNYRLYYSNDTHFNEVGSFVGVEVLKNAIDGNAQDISEVSFDVVDEEYVGDLAILCNLEDVFNQEYKYQLDDSSVDKSKRSDKTILMVGDSFSGCMEPVLKKYFKKATTVNVDAYKPELLEELKPDIVVWESVERYTDRFSWFRFQE